MAIKDDAREDRKGERDRERERGSGAFCVENTLS